MNNNVKIKPEIYEETLQNFMKQYMNEDTPENEKIVSYKICSCSYGGSNDEEETLVASMNFTVEPYSKENTIWNESRRYICFAKLKNVNGEYEVERVSLEPEYYEEFLEKFEEYKAKENVENEAVQSQNFDNYSENNEVKTLSMSIYIICSLILVFAILKIISTIRKK